MRGVRHFGTARPEPRVLPPFLRRIFLPAALNEMLCQKHDVNDQHRKIHERRGIGRQQNAVDDEHDATDGIDDACFRLIVGQKGDDNEDGGHKPQPFVFQNFDDREVQQRSKHGSPTPYFCGPAARRADGI